MLKKEHVGHGTVHNIHVLVHTHNVKVTRNDSLMKPPGLESVNDAMATKCTSGVSMTTDHMTRSRAKRGHRNAYANHRKSAVELLEASKGEYVKSTIVLNHRQELKHPENLSVGNREILSLPISVTRLSPSDEISILDIDSNRNWKISGDESNKQRNTSGDSYERGRIHIASSEDSVRLRAKSLNRREQCDSPLNSDKESNRNRAKSRDRLDPRRSPPSVHSTKFTADSTDSCQAIWHSPATVAKKHSVSSSVVSSASQASNSPSAGKRPSLTSGVSVTTDVLAIKRISVTTLEVSAEFPLGNRHSATSSVISAVSSSIDIPVGKRPSLASSVISDSPSLGKKSSVSPSTVSSPSNVIDQALGCLNAENEGGVFKEPIAPPPKTPNRPAVPPKPGSASKPTTPPKPGPKPDIHSNSEKPVPPPRPPRKRDNLRHSPQSDDNTDSGTPVTMASKQSSAARTTQASCSPDHRRFSSVSASACDKSSRDHGDRESASEKGKPVRGHESRHSLHSQTDSFLKPLCATNLSISVGVLVERNRSPLPKPKVDKELKEVTLPPRRPLHRSQSDLSNCRHSRTSSDFSDISSRLSRTSTEVERFFNEMGLDHSVLEPLRKLSDTNRRDIFDSLSSFGSLDGRSLSSRLSNDLERIPMESESDLSERDAGTTSVVERNARIIKWLCNVKKARNVQTKPVQKKSEN